MANSESPGAKSATLSDLLASGTFRPAGAPQTISTTSPVPSTRTAETPRPVTGPTPSPPTAEIPPTSGREGGATLSDLALAIAGPPHPSSRVARALSEAGVPRTSEFNRVAALARRDLNPLTHPDTSEIFSHTQFQDPCTRPGCAFVSGLR